MSGEPRRARVSGQQWNAATVPRCFASESDWLEWISALERAHSPCEDCSSAYKARMLAAGRCERPETVFVDTEEGEVGISADDPRFARLLAGLKITGAELRKPVEATPVFVRILERIVGRTQPGVRRAIGIFLAQHRRASANVGNGE